MQKVSESPLKKCPDCGKPQLQRLMSAPVFRLKGGGWYETDFKGDKDNQRNIADRPDADASKDAKEADAKGKDDKGANGKDAKATEAKTSDAAPAKESGAAKEKTADKSAEKSPAAAAQKKKKPLKVKRRR
jgi:predicted nucleic acid-binding Zn ribbon protein